MSWEMQRKERKNRKRRAVQFRGRKGTSLLLLKKKFRDKLFSEDTLPSLSLPTPFP